MSCFSKECQDSFCHIAQLLSVLFVQHCRPVGYIPVFIVQNNTPTNVRPGIHRGVFSAFLYPVDQFLLGREPIVHGLYRCAEAGFFGLVQLGDADAPLAHILLCVRLPPRP